jgi:hypothetical protein
MMRGRRRSRRALGVAGLRLKSALARVDRD